MNSVASYSNHSQPGAVPLVPLAALSLRNSSSLKIDPDLKAPETGKTLRPPKNLQRHIVFQWG